jgi:hypothetical protein
MAGAYSTVWVWKTVQNIWRIESVIPAGIEGITSICPAGEGEFYLTADKALWR